MNIENLRNFIKLTQYRSFSELARHISLSQSTLSHQISQLEKEFGNVILIDRTTKKFELTEAGKILLDYAEQIVSLFDKCMEEISQYTEQQKEEIIISASTIPGSHILPKFITEFKEDNMNVQFKIMINNSKESIEHLKRNEANFAGIGSFMSYKESSFDVIKIGQDNFKFICSPNHDLLKDGSNKVHFKDLLKFPFVWREEGSGMRDTFKNQFKDYKELNIKLEINNNDSIISTVNESNYISIMSEIMADKAEDAGLIRYLEIENHPIIAKRSLYFLKMVNIKLSPLKEKFWKYIKSQNKELK